MRDKAQAERRREGLAENLTRVRIYIDALVPPGELLPLGRYTVWYCHPETWARLKDAVVKVLPTATIEVVDRERPNEEAG